DDLPTCSNCNAFMRPGVVGLGEQLPWKEIERVENFLDRGACDVVIVAGTTATFGYIVDWALRASHNGGELIEVNPEATPLSQFATRLVREPAAIALPKLVEEVTARSPPNLISLATSPRIATESRSPRKRSPADNVLPTLHRGFGKES